MTYPFVKTMEMITEALADANNFVGAEPAFLEQTFLEFYTRGPEKCSFGMNKEGHGVWVMCLSKFDEKLWALQPNNPGFYNGWLKKFYTRAFEWAKKLDDWWYCDRLVSAFVRLAPYTCHATEFGITSDVLVWNDCPFDTARCEKTFESETELLKFKIAHYNDMWWNVKHGPELEFLFGMIPKFEELDSIFDRLAEIGDEEAKVVENRRQAKIYILRQKLEMAEANSHFHAIRTLKEMIAGYK